MRRILIALSAVSLLACGDSSGPAFSSAVGTWTQTNNSVTINLSDGTTNTVTISGDIITLSEIGFVSVYHRQ